MTAVESSVERITHVEVPTAEYEAMLALLKEHLADHLEACHLTRRGEVCDLVSQTRDIIARVEGAS